MKKTILLLCMLTFLCPTPIAASEISSTETTNIIVRADIKEWKYKFINGKINYPGASTPAIRRPRQ